MTEAEAKKHLKGIGFLPGKSKTVDMAPDLRAKTKDALRTLKDAAVLGAFVDEMVKAAKPAASAS